MAIIGEGFFSRGTCYQFLEAAFDQSSDALDRKDGVEELGITLADRSRKTGEHIADDLLQLRIPCLAKQSGGGGGVVVVTCKHPWESFNGLRSRGWGL